MELFAATFLVFKVIGNLVRVDYVDDATGQRKTEAFYRGRYSRRDLQPYIQKRGILEYEWGDDGRRKILRLGLEA